MTYALEHEGGGTRLTFEFDVPVLRGVADLLEPLVRIGAPMVERATVKNLERLKERLESDQSKEVNRGKSGRGH